MPFPQNAQTAIEVEETIRKQGAVPATIAIIGGVMKVGLSKEEIELLGREGHNVTKVSRRDLPFVVAAREKWRDYRCINHDYCSTGWD